MCFQKKTAQKIWPNGALSMIWDSSENQFGRPIKKSTKLSKFFLKIRPPPPPRENPRSAPDPNQ